MCANSMSAGCWLLVWITKRRQRIGKRSATRWTSRGMCICHRSRAWAIVSFGSTSRKTASHKAARERWSVLQGTRRDYGPHDPTRGNVRGTGDGLAAGRHRHPQRPAEPWGIAAFPGQEVASLARQRRAGGLTEWLEIGLLADTFNVPYASHGGGAHLHVLAALPNTLFMESGLLPAGTSERLVHGCYLLPEEPGLGDKR